MYFAYAKLASKGLIYMAQTLVNIRMDTELKQNMEAVCRDLGMNMTTAFNIFIRQSLRIGGIPFKIISDERGFYNKYNQITGIKTTIAILRFF